MGAQQFYGPSWQCIHFVADTGVSAAVSAETGGTSRLLQVSLKDIKGDMQLFAAIAGAMQFPTYFGANWDALDECLSDMSWIPSRNYILVLHDSNLAWRSIPQSLGKFVEAWLFAAEQWAKDEVGFHLVFVM